MGIGTALGGVLATELVQFVAEGLTPRFGSSRSAAASAVGGVALGALVAVYGRGFVRGLGVGTASAGTVYAWRSGKAMFGGPV